MRNRPRLAGALILALAGGLVSGAGAPGQDVSVLVSGLRSGRGQVLACLTADPARFPDCGSDPAGRHLAVPVRGTGALAFDFGPVPAGRYAISLFHDENGNGKLDKMILIPREGFGFSRDAPVHFGPPAFSAAAFVVAGEPVHQPIRLRYMLGGRAQN